MYTLIECKLSPKYNKKDFQFIKSYALVENKDMKEQILEKLIKRSEEILRIWLPENIWELYYQFDQFLGCVYIKFTENELKYLTSIGLDKNNLFATDCVVYFRFTSLEIGSITGSI